MRFVKDPGAKKPFGVNFEPWLTNEADTIATVSWEVPTGLTVTAVSPAQPKPAVWLSGGTEGETYRVRCSITTVGGMDDKKSFYLRIAEQ